MADPNSRDTYGLPLTNLQIKIYVENVFVCIRKFILQLSFFITGY